MYIYFKASKEAYMYIYFKAKTTQTIIRKIRRRNTDGIFLFFDIEVTRSLSTVSSLNTQNYCERTNIKQKMVTIVKLPLTRAKRGCVFQ